MRATLFVTVALVFAGTSIVLPRAARAEAAPAARDDVEAKRIRIEAKSLELQRRVEELTKREAVLRDEVARTEEEEKRSLAEKDYARASAMKAKAAELRKAHEAAAADLAMARYVLAKTPDADSAAELRKKFDRKVSFDFVDTPLDEAMGFLRTLTTANIILDRRMEDRKATPITLSVRDMNLWTATEWLCKLADCEMEEKDGALFIRAKEGGREAARGAEETAETLWSVRVKGPNDTGEVAFKLAPRDVPPENRRRLAYLAAGLPLDHVTGLKLYYVRNLDAAGVQGAALADRLRQVCGGDERSVVYDNQVCCLVVRSDDPFLYARVEAMLGRIEPTALKGHEAHENAPAAK